MSTDNNSHAELKPVKVGEPSADNAGGNPEPSRDSLEWLSQACVETRRRVCIVCGGEIAPEKYSSAKYCGKRCAARVGSYLHAVRTGRIKNPGVGSGGDQRGEKNPAYKSGIANYSKVGFAHYGRKCNRCGSEKNLLVHHQDEDRTNNAIENLEVLCKGCHQKHHETRDAFGRYTQRDSPHQQETAGEP